MGNCRFSHEAFWEFVFVGPFMSQPDPILTLDGAAFQSLSWTLLSWLRVHIHLINHGEDFYMGVRFVSCFSNCVIIIKTEVIEILGIPMVNAHEIVTLVTLHEVIKNGH